MALKTKKRMISFYLFSSRLRKNDLHKILNRPVYSSWNKNAADTLPAFSESKYNCTASSTLPMEVLFFLPTPENSMGQTGSYVTEIAYTLFYFNLASKLVGDAVDTREAHFGGFNMIVARSASSSILKRRFYELLDRAWKTFWQSETPTEDMINSVESIIDEVCNNSEDNSSKELIEEVQKIKEKIQGRPFASLKQEIISDFNTLAVRCDSCPYGWIGIDSLITEINQKNLAAKNGISLSAVIEAYQRKYVRMHDASELSDQLLSDLNEKLSKAERLYKSRGQSKIARLVNGADGAKKEIQGKIKDFLNTWVDRFVDAHRAAATIPRMPQPLTISEFRLLPKYSQNARKVESLIEKSEETDKSKKKGFIFEDFDTQTKLNIDPQGINFSQICFEALLSKDESALSNILKNHESTGITLLRDKAKKEMGQANPLLNLKTSIPADLNSYSADVFRVQSPHKGNMHFCYICGQQAAGKIIWPNWGTLNGKLGFPSFNHQFGAGNENATADLASIKDGPGRDKLWFNESFSEDAFANIQGIWLGTLSLERKIAEILGDAFRGARVGDWEEQAWQAATIGGDVKRRLMTLREMVYMGLILGAVAKKVVDVTQTVADPFNSAHVNLLVESQDGGQAIIKAQNSNLENLGFSSNLKMENVRLDWIDNLMKWIQNSRGSFARDFELGPDSIEGKLLFERQCLTRITMEIPQDIQRGIEELFEKIYAYIKVDLVK